MSVMAAGVHFAGNLRAVRDVVFLLNGQRVHICAQRDDAAVIKAWNDGHDADFGRQERDAQRLQICADKGFRAMRIKADLGVHVDVAAVVHGVFVCVRQKRLQRSGE